MAFPRSLPCWLLSLLVSCCLFQSPFFLLVFHHRALGLEGVGSPSQERVLDLSEWTGVPSISQRPKGGSPAPCPSLPLCHLYGVSGRHHPVLLALSS